MLRSLRDQCTGFLLSSVQGSRIRQNSVLSFQVQVAGFARIRFFPFRFRVAGFARIRFMTDVDVLRSLRDQCSRCCVPVVALRLPPANGCDPFGINALDNP